MHAPVINTQPADTSTSYTSRTPHPHLPPQHREAVREAHAGRGPNPVPVDHRLEGKALDKFIRSEMSEDDREGTGTGFYTSVGVAVFVMWCMPGMVKRCAPLHDLPFLLIHPPKRTATPAGCTRPPPSART